jgi:DNA polymerase III sliding clamp (beta) subunit (PCNA family)
MTTATQLETVIIIPAPALDDLLGGALLAAGKDTSMPQLATVLLESAAGIVTAVASDRYRLHVGTIVQADASAGDFPRTLITRQDATAIKSLIKPHLTRSINPAVTISLAGDWVTVRTIDGEIKFRAYDAKFPEYKNLIPTEFAPADEIGVNPKFLADMAKIPGLDKSRPLIIRTSGSKKPLLATVETDNVSWQLLLMPMRIA